MLKKLTDQNKIRTLNITKKRKLKSHTRKQIKDLKKL